MPLHAVDGGPCSHVRTIHGRMTTKQSGTNLRKPEEEAMNLEGRRQGPTVQIHVLRQELVGLV